jgi:hypothetical protein
MTYKPQMQAMPIERCRHITSKGMRIFGDDYKTPVDEDARTNDFWCQKTHTALGPDKGLVVLSRCAPGRDCFESL